MFSIYNNNYMEEYILPTNILEADIDEANRGGLIGEVVSACVVMKYTEDEIEINKYKEIKDSKKLTTKKRTMLVEYIKNNSVTYGIGTASVEEIDSINILNATMKAMRRAANEAYKKHYFENSFVTLFPCVKHSTIFSIQSSNSFLFFSFMYGIIHPHN